MNYLKDAFSPVATPQSQPIPGEAQVPNSAGGYAYAVDKWSHLHRFLILGSEGGSYYAGQQTLTRENAVNVLACIDEDGPRAVQIICDVSRDGRAPKNDPAIFALALASVKGDEATRKAAYAAVPVVCRIGTHIFQFAEFRESFGGWSRGSRRAVAEWYTDKPLDKLAYQGIKYRQRNGWSHRDLLRLSHPKADTPEQNLLLKYLSTKQTPGDIEHTVPNENLPQIIHGYEAAQRSKSPAETAKLVREFGLPREALQTEHLNSIEVWEAMLDAGMPMTALIRNLATMTRNSIIAQGLGGRTSQIAQQIVNKEAILKARVHPIAILIALRTYAAGHSLRGSNTWTPVPQIIDALDEAFYLAFDNVQPTGKKRLIALDISGSMWGGMVAGVPGFTPAEASAAMAMVSMKTGDPYGVVAFTGGGWYGSRRGQAPNTLIDGLSGMTLSPRQRLDDVAKAMHEISRYMGGTDCSLPSEYLRQTGQSADVIEIYTDSETWAGNIHPSESIRLLRKESGVNTKLVVVGMVSNGFSIADPNDPGMLDVVGFDTATPNLISAFVEGQF
jgi:60 kDa SS-A/Ro ribonucleoprotein